MLIVVAEEDAAVRRLLRRALERLGHEGVEAESVPELERLCAVRSPGAVLIDASMGDGDGGVAAGLKLQGRKPGLPVVMTARTLANAGRAVRAGFLDVLAKPFELAQLDAALRGALSRR